VSGSALIVVPCFNEERRLDTRRLAALASDVRLLLVDDGSTDGTSELLRTLASDSNAIEVLELPRNAGKAEAVRQGLLRGLESGASVLGYYDADLATPPDELLRLLSVLEKKQLSFVMGARVGLLGRRIERGLVRHYGGRVFATLAGIALGIRVYDTQCGAKVFRASPAVAAAVERPFRSSWVFDVELIGRLLRGTDSIPPVPAEEFEEVPLRVWRDVPGSKLRVRDVARAFADLAAVAAELRAPDRR
jgi:glycosyltransferase involved in cell wall biosynthesis